MSWRLEGTYFENCNCDLICPCIAGFRLPADNERCEFVFAFAIRAGEVEGTDVGGLNVAFVGDAARLMDDFRIGLFVDERATAAQRDRLEAFCTGRLGGPFADVVEVLGVETTAIEFVEEGRFHRLVIPGAVELEVEDAKGSRGGVRRISGLGHFASSTLAVARATKSNIKAFGLEFSNKDKNAHSAPFAWSG